jgi:hypothetical protein
VVLGSDKLPATAPEMPLFGGICLCLFLDFSGNLNSTNHSDTKQTREAVQKQKNCWVFQSQQAARGPKNGRVKVSCPKLGRKLLTHWHKIILKNGIGNEIGSRIYKYSIKITFQGG